MASERFHNLKFLKNDGHFFGKRIAQFFPFFPEKRFVIFSPGFQGIVFAFQPGEVKGDVFAVGCHIKNCNLAK